MLKQAQVVMTFIPDPPCREVCPCPFCNTLIVGMWHPVYDDYLMPVATCRHFVDFVAGAKGQPTALFTGYAEKE